MITVLKYIAGAILIFYLGFVTGKKSMIVFLMLGRASKVYVVLELILRYRIERMEHKKKNEKE